MTDRAPLKNLALSDTGFLFDPRSGATFTLNPSGLSVVRALRDGKTLAEVTTLLSDEFLETPEEIKEDIQDFIQALSRNGLLPADFRVD